MELGTSLAHFRPIYYPYFRGEGTEALVSALESHKDIIWLQEGPTLKSWTTDSQTFVSESLVESLLKCRFLAPPQKRLIHWAWVQAEEPAFPKHWLPLNQAPR